MRQTVMLISLTYRKLKDVSGSFLLYTFLFASLNFCPLAGIAQNEPLYDEISVSLNIQNFGGIEIPAVILDETVYLPIVDILTFLKIKNTPSAQFDSVKGFFINTQATYIIDRINHRINFQGKVFDLKSSDMIKTESNLFLKSNWFGQVFGLDCNFNFRSLSVVLSTKLELPVIREMRLEQMRANISRLQGEVKTDTTIARKYPAFHFGMADWSVISTQLIGGKTDTRLNLALGTVLAGGEANVLLNYDNVTPFSEKQQRYQWRFVNNERAVLRQVTAGKIYSQVTSSIYDPVVGVQFTNTPTTYRRSFGTYTLSDITEPNWTVELYVNNVLVDYMKADASGFFKFEVPLVYGNSAVKLKFYGPWGEERIKEQNINIPFNFLPPRELEYSVSAGMVEDTLSSRFSRATLNYGVNRRITVGGGVEYLSSVVTGTTMPFLSASMRVLSGLLLTGEYTYGVRSKGLLSYRLPSNLQVELNYTKYQPGQKAIIFNYLEERKATISIPIKGKKFSAYSRLTVNQIVLPELKNTTAEMLWSGSVYGVSTNLSTYGLFTDLNNPYVYSNLSLAFRLPARITLTPQVQYNYNTGALISARTALEKPLFKNGFLNMSYERNFLSNTRNIEFGFRYDLSFAQTGFSVRNSNDQVALVESLRGSLLYDSKTNYVGANNRTNVGKGALTLLPFLDINGNGMHDKGEPKVAGLQVRINGGTIIRNEKDTTIRVLDLTPYTSYLLELDQNSFDNIAWQMHNLTMKVNIDANQFKTIDVPVSVVGEATGTVYSGSKGQGRVLVCFYRSDLSLAGRVLTESDGYYSYMGLKPGKYIARIDPEQLKKIRMIASPESIPVNINANRDGDIVDGLDFRLSSVNKDQVPDNSNITPPAIPESPAPVIAPAPAVITPAATKTTPVVVTTPAKSGTTAVQSPEGKTVPAPAKEVKKEVVSAPLKEAVNKPATVPTPQKEEKTETTKAPAPVKEVVTPSKTGVTSPKPETENKKSGQTSTQPAAGINEAINSQQKFDEAARAKYPILKNRIGSAIQVGAFSKELNAVKVKQDLLRTTDHPIDIIYEDGLFKVQISGFLGRRTSIEYLPKLIQKGYAEAFVVRTD